MLELTPNIRIISNSIIKVWLTKLRSTKTDRYDFHNCLDQVVKLMSSQVFGDIPIVNIPITTPLASTTGYQIQKKIVIVSILRTGLAMGTTVRRILPQAITVHFGIQRQPYPLQHRTYFLTQNLQTVKLTGQTVYILDPMIATGITMMIAIEKLIAMEVEKIYIFSIIGTKSAINKITSRFPKVIIFISEIDPELNKNNFIVPGLGHVGNRYFGI